MSTHDLAAMLKAAGVEVSSNLSSVEEADVERVLSAAARSTAEPVSVPPAQAPESTPAQAPEPKASPAPAEAAQEPPRPRGPRIVARAEDLKAQEQARATRPAAGKGAKRKGRRVRLEDLPTVVGPDVPLRKGVKPPENVRLKGEEPPKPAPQRPQAKPERTERSSSRSGTPQAAVPRTPPAVRPPKPAAAPEVSRPSARAKEQAKQVQPRRMREVEEKIGKAPKLLSQDFFDDDFDIYVDLEPSALPLPSLGGTPAHPHARRGDELGGKRRVVIDSQAGRKGQRQATRKAQGPKTSDTEKAAKKKAPPGTEAPVVLPSGATVKDFSEALEIPASEVIKTMMRLGEMVTITQSLADEAILLLAEEFGRKVTIKHAEEEEAERPEFVDDPADLVERAPVVTVMGHVDHGKTSLLDAIRETQVAAAEAGGITQHIGAYVVDHNGRQVTFIDTPGHEAFTAMRARGANMTDIAVIVVAANDGVMPQTIEAINHARAAGVPILVAINKIDLPDANPDRVRHQLSEQGLVPEEWGGDTIMVEVSAKKRINLEELMDMILLLADVQELKANPKAPASGTIIEAELDPGRGPVATMLVQRGTLRVGDAIVSGESYGKVKAMFDFRGAPLKEAGPSVPVQILGFNSVPVAGDFVQVVKDERTARQKAEARAARLRMEQMAKARAAASLDDLFRRMKEGTVKELNLIIKGDVVGSVEALSEALTGIEHPEVKVRVIHAAVGGINESDINLAAASHAVVIGFNVRPSTAAKALAENLGVDVRTYRVIYKAIEDVQAALVGMLEPEHVEVELGTAEVRRIFRASKIGVIGGCYVQSGKIVRNAKVRVVRDGSIVHEGAISSLRRFQEDVREVLAGFECGVHIDGFDDLKEGDILEVYEIKEVARGQ